MELILQPRPSAICGQCCLAMVTGRPLEEIHQRVGHTHGTKTRELVRVLRDLGFSVPPRLQLRKSPPALAIAKVQTGKRNWHWVVWNRGQVYCPSWGILDPEQKLIPISSYLVLEE